MISLLASAAGLACMSAPLPPQTLHPIGEANFKKAFFNLYDASLCASTPEFTWDSTFAITLDYNRGFSSKQLTKATIVEMARLSGQDEETFDPIRQTVSQCFPDVEKNDQITGISLGADQAVFYKNGSQTCDVKWDGFREHFFGIWLSDESRSEKKSRRLRGLEK